VVDPVTISYPELSRAGRLGNQLWEIASTYGIACGQLDDPSFPAWDYQPYFSCPDEWFGNCRGTPATNFVSYMDPRARGYLQDYNLFKGVEKQVKQYFQPSPEAIEILGAHFVDYGFDSMVGPRISVHIRRGDNVTHPSGYHPLRSWDYYRSALDLTSPDGSIVVFSDDPKWCDENFEKETGRKPALVFEAAGPRPREYADRAAYENAPVLDWIDLQLMAGCDEHILSNSTYAWWGAFLSNNPSPIYPSNWFGWRVSEFTDASIMFPESWREVHDPTMGGVTR
jgi:Glycosyl transferase family 11